MNFQVDEIIGGGGQKDMFATPIFSLGGGGAKGYVCHPNIFIGGGGNLPPPPRIDASVIQHGKSACTLLQEPQLCYIQALQSC